MSDIASLLKSEISRLSKKTIRQHMAPVQAATTSHRRQLAAMKRQIAQLEQEVKKLRRVASSGAPAKAPPEDGGKLRFVAKGLKSLRTRLGLSAEELGALLGVSGQSVYNWESKKTVPRAAQVAAIAALRGLGKREAQARLEIVVAKPAKAAKAAKKKGKAAPAQS